MPNLLPYFMRYFLLLFVLAMPFCALSQANYRKGSITDNNAQTISGYINYGEWDLNPKYVEFKTNKDDKVVQKIYPSTIKSFVIDGQDQYYTYAGPISLNRVNYPNLAYTIDTTTKTADVFFKLIATGEHLSLYAYSDSLKIRYFIQEKQAQPFELSYQNYFDASGTNMLTSKRYLSQLSFLANKYAKGNSALINKIEKAGYNSDDITAVVNTINGSPVNNKLAKHHSIHTSYFIGAAFNTTHTAFEGNTDLTTGGKSTASAPKFDLGIDFFTNPSIQRFIFRVDLSYYHINPTLTGIVYSSTSGQFTDAYSFDQSVIVLTPQVIFNIYNTDAFKFFVGAGMGFNFTSNKNVTYRYVGVFNKDISTSYALLEQWSSFPLQAGVVLNKRVELFASYTVGLSYLTGAGDIVLYTDAYTAGIHYLFGKAK
jgi:hypothetical protein